MNNKSYKKDLTKRTYRTNKKYFRAENCKGNENNRNSLISEILKNKKYLKMFANKEKNNNIDNIRNNFQNIFSTDENSLNTLKYIMKSRQEQKDLNSNYIKNNVGFFPKEETVRVSTSVKTIHRPCHSLSNSRQNNRKKSNYTKRNILQFSCDNILIDDEFSSPSNSKDIHKESKRKYNKRIIINNINNNDNDNDDNEKNKKYQIRKNKTTYECLSKVNNNIKSYKFPFLNSTNKNQKCNINITPSNINKNNDQIKEEEHKKKKEDEEKIKDEFKDMQDNQIDKNNYLNISFSEDGPFIGQSENNEKKDKIIINNNEKNANNLKDNNEEEKNKIISINSHEISFGSFRNENDFENSNNNSFDIQEASKNSFKDLKNNKLYVESKENNINIINEKKENDKLIFNSEKELINYIKNKKIKIDNNDDENKEKVLSNEEIKRIQNENELLRKKISEIYYAYQEIYKLNIALNEENSRFKKLNSNKYNIESNIKFNIIKAQHNQPNIININNSDLNMKIEAEIYDDKKTKNEDLKNEQNNGILTKAVSKFMNFFNEKKKKEEEEP